MKIGRLIFIFMFLAASVQAGDAYFGITTLDAGTADAWMPLQNTIRGPKFTITENGTADSLYAQISHEGSDSKLKGAIYRAGDTTQVAASSEVTVSGNVNGWQAMPITATLKADTAYFLMFWADNIPADSMHIRRGDSAGFNYIYKASQTYGTWPDPLTAMTNYSAGFLVGYCSYTAGAPAAVTKQIGAGKLGAGKW